VHAFGLNSKGQLGVEEKHGDKIMIPMLVKSLVDITQVNCGLWHCLALDGRG